MTKKAIDYSKTVIYRIVCLNPSINECYVGHTTDFTSRKNQHKSNVNNIKRKHYNLKVYKFIRENGGWKNWCMLKIIDYPCNNGYEARNQERFYLEQFKATLNSSIPNQTDKEYQETHKQEKKEYYQTHKEYFIEKQQQYNNTHKEYYKKYRDELPYSFVCDCCNYKAQTNTLFKRHCFTIKHLTNLEKL